MSLVIHIMLVCLTTMMLPYNAAYTTDTDNADVVSNSNKYGANDSDNDHSNDNTKNGNNSGMDEVPILLMMGQDKIDSLILKNTCPVKILMDLRSRDVKLEMRMISSLASNSFISWSMEHGAWRHSLQ